MEKRFYISFIVIVVVSCIAGYFLNMIFVFERDALNWFCSSIAQGFLALMAIIASIGLYLVRNISNNFIRVTDNLTRNVTITPQNVQDPSIRRELREVINGQDTSGQQFNQNMERVTSNILPSLVSIIILVLSSLLVLIFTGGHLRISIDIEKNLIFAIIMSFIFLWSIYCLYELLNLFSIVFNLRYRSRRNT